MSTIREFSLRLTLRAGPGTGQFVTKPLARAIHAAYFPIRAARLGAMASRGPPRPAALPCLPLSVFYEGSASSEESLLHILSAPLKFLVFRALPRNLGLFLV